MGQGQGFWNNTKLMSIKSVLVLECTAKCLFSCRLNWCRFLRLSNPVETTFLFVFQLAIFTISNAKLASSQTLSESRERSPEIVIRCSSKFSITAAHSCNAFVLVFMIRLFSLNDSKSNVCLFNMNNLI